MERSRKLSVSLPASLVSYLEDYQQKHGLKTKSSVVERALETLRQQELETEYRSAAREQGVGSDAEAWDFAAGDGLEGEQWQ